MIAGLDSSFDVPSAAQLAEAKRHGVRMWSGYLQTRPGVNIGHAWEQAEFARVRAAGLAVMAFCSGDDDPVACKNLAAAWGVRLCLDVESGIRGDGPWVQAWLHQSGAGLYGNAPVFANRQAAFYVLAAYPGNNPTSTWTNDPLHPRPHGPCGWQWQGTHQEFGCGVDRGWYDDWFAEHPDGQGGNHWSSLGGSVEHGPVAAQNLDGRLELFALDAHAHLQDLAQEAPNGGWWSNWVDLGPPPTPSAGGDPIVARNLDGRLDVFLYASDGVIYHRWQRGPGGALTEDWTSIGGSFPNDPVSAQNLDGRLELFALGSDSHLFELAQSAANGSWWTSWADLARRRRARPVGSQCSRATWTAALKCSCAAATVTSTTSRSSRPAPRLPRSGRRSQARGHRMRAARTRTGGSSCSRSASTATCASWPKRPPTATGGRARLTSARLPPPAPSGGRSSDATPMAGLEVFIRGADGKLYHRWQQAPGASLTQAWASLGGSLKDDPVVARNRDERLEAFALPPITASRTTGRSPLDMGGPDSNDRPSPAPRPISTGRRTPSHLSESRDQNKATRQANGATIGAWLEDGDPGSGQVKTIAGQGCAAGREHADDDT